ncbi:ankyrin-2-like isoform X5 [Syngnathoides biaculeatus]|uniref:ankyrin-2-like isoform X5 n=1 Tax=Syngnathoides biaculeatus TaxID=300417 RepID=UPI002ADDA244|nr:ankyrin-2-like isoform X5 [Syngnathoides biaculeatus]
MNVTVSSTSPVPRHLSTKARVCPVILEVPHFAALRGGERELVILRSETGESWKEHHCEHTQEELNQILNSMDEELDSQEELQKKRICRIITRDLPQYFAVVSRIRQDGILIGPEGGVLSSTVVPQVQAVFPEGALTKRIRVGLQAQPVSLDIVRRALGNKSSFSPIVTLEPRRRKFHKPITVTIPVPKGNSDPVLHGIGLDTPTLRLLCSITGGTTPAQWEDITGTTPLTFDSDRVSFTTNVSARFWLIDCRQVQESVNFSSQVYREIICVPYMAKFVIFAKTPDPVEGHLRCFCMTDDKTDKTLEQQENFTEVARSRDVEVLEGKPIYADCCGNFVPLTKSGQHHHFSFFAFKENRLTLFIKIRDNTQELCGRLCFLKEPRSHRLLAHNAICNLNITLPSYCKESDSDQDEEANTTQQRSVIYEDPEEDDTSDSSEPQKRVTAKMKSVDEMEGDIEFPRDTQCKFGVKRLTEETGLPLLVFSHNKVHSSFSAGVHDGPNAKDLNQTARMSQEEAKKDLSKLTLKTALQPTVAPAVVADTRSHSKAALTPNTENRTDEQKEDSLRKSKEIMPELGVARLPNFTPASNVTDEVKAGPEVGLDTHSETKESFKPQFCIYDDTDEDELEHPRTESKGVTARVDAAYSWSAMLDNGNDFEARLKVEDEKILNLVVDSQSLPGTPDTTPGKTPTEESTPTSEPNPFLFQEGKLFEMTRSGAIDMTKRSCEQDVGGFAFFQIGEHPHEEPILENSKQECRASAAQQEVGLNLKLEVKIKEQAEETVPSQLQLATEVDQASAKSKIPKMGLSASAKPAAKDQPNPGSQMAETDHNINRASSDLDSSSPDQMIMNVENAETTITRSIYAEQGRESSDSSPDDSKSLIQTPKLTEVPQQSASGTVPLKTQSKPPHQVQNKTAPAAVAKSRIPIKSKSLKSESLGKSAEDKKHREPSNRDTHRKSEMDTGTCVDVKTKTSTKNLSEGASIRATANKGESKPKVFQSRLPIKGKSGASSSQSSTTSKDKSKTRKHSAGAFEEISDEAAKLVERLAEEKKDDDDDASEDERGLIDLSVLKRDSFGDMHPLPLGEVLAIGRLHDVAVETQMEQIVDGRAQSQGAQGGAESKKQTLSVIADHLGFSWEELARELEFSEERINFIRTENPDSLRDQSYALLDLWTEGEGIDAIETTLIKRLSEINRRDIVDLIHNRETPSAQEGSSDTTAMKPEPQNEMDSTCTPEASGEPARGVKQQRPGATPSSRFEVEPAKDRKVGKVVKTTVTTRRRSRDTSREHLEKTPDTSSPAGERPSRKTAAAP